MFHCLPDSAWADGKLAEAAGQLGKMVEHPNQSQPNPGSPGDVSPCIVCPIFPWSLLLQSPHHRLVPSSRVVRRSHRALRIEEQEPQQRDDPEDRLAAQGRWAFRMGRHPVKSEMLYWDNIIAPLAQMIMGFIRPKGTARVC